jgi:hypothetical protein
MMTHEMLQTHDTNPLVALPTRLLVAMEMSLKTWRLVMAPAGATRKRVKTIEAGNYLTLEQAVTAARERFKLPAQTPVVFCYEAGRDGLPVSPAHAGASRRSRMGSTAKSWRN